MFQAAREIKLHISICSFSKEPRKSHETLSVSLQQVVDRWQISWLNVIHYALCTTVPLCKIHFTASISLPLSSLTSCKPPKIISPPFKQFPLSLRLTSWLSFCDQAISLLIKICSCLGDFFLVYLTLKRRSRPLDRLILFSTDRLRFPLQLLYRVMTLLFPRKESTALWIFATIPSFISGQHTDVPRECLYLPDCLSNNQKKNVVYRFSGWTPQSWSGNGSAFIFRL